MNEIDDAYFERIPDVPLKYVFNTSEEIFRDNFDDEKFEVIRGGSGNNKKGLKARDSEIRASHLNSIKTFANKISDLYTKTLIEKIGSEKYKEYRDVIYQYCHDYGSSKVLDKVDSFKFLINYYFEQHNYNKYYCEEVKNESDLKYLTISDIPILLEINAEYFERLYKECEEPNAWTFIHRGIKKLSRCNTFPDDVHYEKHLLSSYSFSVSLPEFFSGHKLSGHNIPVMIGAIAEECSTRVIGIPMLLKDFKEFHYDSFEIILIPPLTITNIYQDIDMDGTLEFISLKTHDNKTHWYLKSINSDD